MQMMLAFGMTIGIGFFLFAVFVQQQTCERGKGPIGPLCVVFVTVASICAVHWYQHEDELEKLDHGRFSSRALAKLERRMFSGGTYPEGYVSYKEREENRAEAMTRLKKRIGNFQLLMALSAVGAVVSLMHNKKVF